MHSGGQPDRDAADHPQPVLPPAFRSSPRTVAHVVAEFLAAQGVGTIYGLCGGHIQPIWDEAVRAGIRVVDVRHEAAAVHMAQAVADLTGTIGVATVTAGPGFTNAITGIASAHAARSPVLVISGRPPRPQIGMGALQDLPQHELVRPICRLVEGITQARRLLPALDAAVAAALGDDGPQGPAYVDFPTDVLRETVPNAYADARWPVRRTRAPIVPDPRAVEEAAERIRRSRRPIVVAGRGALGDPAALARFLDASGAIYLDTGESRGALSSDHPASLPAVRGRALAEADLVLTLGRRLDFQLAYGSLAVFSPQATFVRVGRTREELSSNGGDDLEVRGDTHAVVAALVEVGAVPRDPDVEWREALRALNSARVERLADIVRRAALGPDGRMHPYQLLAAVDRLVAPETIVVVDGGDILSFARVALRTPAYLDPGALGCLGVGVPFAVAAALAFPGRRVVAVIGDGSFGFHAMEIDTAVRTGASALFVVANNEAWNIERQDQVSSYDGNVVGTELPGCRYDLLARALGAHGERVEDPEKLPAALDLALARLPALLDVTVTRSARSPDFESGLASVPDYHALGSWDRAERRLLEEG